MGKDCHYLSPDLLATSTFALSQHFQLDFQFEHDIDYNGLCVCVCATLRHVFALRETPERKALSYLQTGQQLVLHLPTPHLPVP